MQKLHTHKLRMGFKIMLVAIFSGLAITPILQTSVANADRQPTLEIISPTASSVNKGVITLSFKVNGLSTDQYEPFWAVGDDQWNRMSTTNGMSTTDIDITNWSWNAEGRYVLSFIALKKENWQPIIQKKTFTINRQTNKAAIIDSSLTIPIQLPILPANKTVSNIDKKLVSNATLFVDPESDAQAKAKAWVQLHPEDNNQMSKLISQPLANWYGDWNKDVRNDVNRYVTNAANAGQIPVLVVYNIPNRDCGSYSAGGVRDQQAYASWISKVANGIGNHDAIVLLEPDALAGIDCLSKEAQTERIDIIRSSVKTLKTLTKAKVYLDAGHPEWQSTNEMVARLKQAGISEADGFSLNISNFTSTEKNITYGAELSYKTNNAHFVIDTSRNGSGPALNFEWCNPTGVKTGANPTLSTGQNLVDAYLWVKAPGGSDGTCGAQQLGTFAPPAGEWWPQYALSILR